MEDTRVNIGDELVKIKKISKTSYFFNKFIINPFWAGVTGFTLFFLFAIFLDFAVYIFDADQSITIDIYTVLIGLAGFLLAFGFSFLESTQK